MAYFRNLVNDSLFVRTCIALVSLLFAGLFSLPLIFCSFSKNFWDIIGLIICVIVVLGSIYLFFVSVFGSERSLGKLMDHFDTSGVDFFGMLFLVFIFIFVGIVAIPITMIIRFFMPRNMALEFLESERKKNNEQS